MSQLIHFYLPLPGHIDIPNDINNYWEWQIQTKGLSKLWGQYHWIIQTYLYLKNHVPNLSFAKKLPDEGIIISHIDSLKDIVPSKKRFIIAAMVDKGFITPYANIYIRHSEAPKKITSQYSWHKTYKINPWPQVNLIKRNPARKNTFKNIAFFGNPEQLAQELKTEEFKSKLNNMGLEWIMQPAEKWNNFENIDAVVAIRSFHRNNMMHKPALKLINAWSAETPCILGYENEYRKIGTPNQNYIEANSIKDVYEAIQELKENSNLRDKIIENGKYALKKYNTESVIKEWIYFFSKILPAHVSAWQGSPIDRHILNTKGKILSFIKNIKSKNIPG